LNAHLGFDALFTGAHDHLPVFPEVLSEWFLTIHVFAHFHGGQSDGSMHVIRSGHMAGVNGITLFREQLAPVTIDAQIRKFLGVLGFERLQRPEIDIGHRHQLEFFVADE